MVCLLVCGCGGMGVSMVCGKVCILAWAVCTDGVLMSAAGCALLRVCLPSRIPRATIWISNYIPCEQDAWHHKVSDVAGPVQSSSKLLLQTFGIFGHFESTRAAECVPVPGRDTYIYKNQVDSTLSPLLSQSLRIPFPTHSHTLILWLSADGRMSIVTLTQSNDCSLIPQHKWRSP